MSWQIVYIGVLLYMILFFWKHLIRGVIKKFLTWPSSVQNKIKIAFASYCSKAQNTTCAMWLLGYKYFVHFSGRQLQLFAYDMEKTELRSREWHGNRYRGIFAVTAVMGTFL